MTQDILPNLTDLQTYAASGRSRPERARRVAQFGPSLGSTLTEMASGSAMMGGADLRLTSGEPLSHLSDQMAEGIVLFSRSDRVIVNNYGVFVPLNILGRDSSISHEERRELDGSVRITILAHPRGAKRNVRISQPIDCTRELGWLSEHRHEYIGQWVALDGDRLLSHGPDAREVYERARNLGVPVPSVVRIEASDELPFAGW